MVDCYSSDCTGISSVFSYLNFILQCEGCIPCMVKDTACFCYCVSQDGSKKLWCLRVVATDRPYAKMADILIFF